MIPTVLSDDLFANILVACIICGRSVPAPNATAGSLYADGRQAFACDIHIRNRSHWINAWAIFNARQQTLPRALSDKEPA